MANAESDSTIISDTTSLNSEMYHLISSVRDALTDEMVTRLSETLSNSIDLLDKINRSGIERALPSITRIIDNGDLERIVNMARMLGAAADSLNEEMVTRLAATMTEMLLLVDRLSRSDGFMRLVQMVEREDLLESILDIIESAYKAGDEMMDTPPMQGGLRNLWRLVTQAETQEALQFVVLFSQHLQTLDRQ